MRGKLAKQLRKSVFGDSSGSQVRALTRYVYMQPARVKKGMMIVCLDPRQTYRVVKDIYKNSQDREAFRKEVQRVIRENITAGYRPIPGGAPTILGRPIHIKEMGEQPGLNPLDARNLRPTGSAPDSEAPRG